MWESHKKGAGLTQGCWCPGAPIGYPGACPPAMRTGRDYPQENGRTQPVSPPETMQWVPFPGWHGDGDKEKHAQGPWTRHVVRVQCWGSQFLLEIQHVAVVRPSIPWATLLNSEVGPSREGTEWRSLASTPCCRLLALGSALCLHDLIQALQPFSNEGILQMRKLG